MSEASAKVTPEKRTHGHGAIATIAGGSGSSNSAIPGLGANAATGGATTGSATPADPEMKGWLLKWTNYIKGYQRRWFVLSKGVLSYYRNQAEIHTTCRGTISLHGALIHTVDSYTFVISNGGTQTFHIKAANEVERQSWVTALELAKAKAIRTMETEEDEEEETAQVIPSQEINTVVHELTERLENMRTCYDLITKHGVALQRALADLEANDEDTIAARTKIVNERATLFRITSNAMINACNDYLRTAESQCHKWSKMLQHEREQRQRLEEMVEQLAKQHTQLEQAAHLVQHNKSNAHAQSPGGNKSSQANAVSSPTALTSDDENDNEFFDAEENGPYFGDYDFYEEDDEEEEAPVGIPAGAAVGATSGARPASIVAFDSQPRVSTIRPLVQQQQQQDGEQVWVQSQQQQHSDDNGGGAFVMKLPKRPSRSSQEQDQLNNSSSSETEQQQDQQQLSDQPARRSLERASTSGAIVERQSTRLSASASANERQSRSGSQSARLIVAEQRMSRFSTEPNSELTERRPTPTSGSSIVSTRSSKVGGAAAAGVDKVDQAMSRTSTGSSIAVVAGPLVASKHKMERRTRVPDKPMYPLNLWSIMKNCIGKELSKIPMPVNFNEPLSMLQRLTEDYEYADLLDAAARCTDECEQLAYVAAFTISSYSTTANRTGKPFNPLLGETFECDRMDDLGWRCLAEQVSHHPPMAAIHCEGREWTCWQEFTMTSKFRGKYLQVIPLGSAYAQFNATGHKYTWRKVTTTVNNIIVGKLWVDQHGEMEITGLKAAAGIKCVLKYIPYSYFSRETQRRVKGVIMNRRDEVKWVLRGTWDSKIEIAPVLETTGTPDSPVYKTSAYKTVWNRRMPAADSERYHNFTELACQLNEMEAGVAPTDSRRRPDQRLMEDGRWDESNSEKLRLEEKQRLKRREREQEAEAALRKGRPYPPYEPVWFERKQEDGTDNVVHSYKGTYWEHKSSQNWTPCPDIF